MSNSLNDIKHVLTVSASIDSVWNLLNRPDRVSDWLGCMQYSGKIGSVFYMQPDQEKRKSGLVDGATHCELIELSDYRMRFTWFLPNTPKTEVCISLESAAVDSTTITLIHSGWDQFERKDIEQIWQMLKSGWESGVLANLKRMVESN